jgi:hypothetical protein
MPNKKKRTKSGCCICKLLLRKVKVRLRSELGWNPFRICCHWVSLLVYIFIQMLFKRDGVLKWSSVLQTLLLRTHEQRWGIINLPSDTISDVPVPWTSFVSLFAIVCAVKWGPTILLKVRLAFYRYFMCLNTGVTIRKCVHVVAYAFISAPAHWWNHVYTYKCYSVNSGECYEFSTI